MCLDESMAHSSHYVVIPSFALKAGGDVLGSGQQGAERVQSKRPHGLKEVVGQLVRESCGEGQGVPTS